MIYLKLFDMYSEQAINDILDWKGTVVKCLSVWAIIVQVKGSPLNENI